MQRHEFSRSSNVQAATFDPDTGIVEVEFKKDRRRYGGFTAQEFAEWIEARSAGSWFFQNVRKCPDKHPEIVDSSTAELVIADETTPEVPADGWRDLQPNTVAIHMPGESSANLAAEIARRERDAGSRPVLFRRTPGERVDVEPPTRPEPRAPRAEPLYKSALARARASRKQS